MSSKKIRITLISLLVLLGLAGGGYALVDHIKSQQEQAEQEEAASLKLFSFDPNTVDSVEVTNSDGYFRIGSNESGWEVTETDFPHPFTLNNYYVNVINSSMGQLTAKKKIQADSESLSSYGLDDPVTVVCHAGGADYTLLVGTGSVTNEFYYVTVPDSDTVYAIDYQVGEALRGGIGYLREPYLFHYTENLIRGFSLDHLGETAYDLTMDEAGQWQLAAPITDVDIDTVQVNSILTDLVRVEYASFEKYIEDEAELAAYGLDKPAYTVTLSTENAQTVLYFPDFDPNDAVLYVYNPEEQSVGTINMRDSSFLTGKWQQLVRPALLQVPFEQAESLDVTVDGKHFTLSIDHENGTYKLDDIDITAMNDNIKRIFENLYASVSEMKFEEIVENPDVDVDAPTGMQPDCSFVYTLTDGSQRTLELVSTTEENTYWAYIDHRCIGEKVRRNALSGTSGVLNFLEKMTDALADEGITYEPSDATELVSETEESTESSED